MYFCHPENNQTALATGCLHAPVCETIKMRFTARTSHAIVSYVVNHVLVYMHGCILDKKRAAARSLSRCTLHISILSIYALAPASCRGTKLLYTYSYENPMHMMPPA
jgi:hypothetical protein